VRRVLAAILLATPLGACAQSREPAAPAIASSPGVARAGDAALPRGSGERVDRRTPIVRTVERVGPAVVSISTEALVRNPYYGGGSPFDALFGRSRPDEPREQYMPNSLGSGVIVDPEGYVVTNEHVLAAASRVTVTLLDGRQVEAEFVGSAPDFDLALLKLKGDGPFPHVSPEFDEPLHPGETVIAIGNPFGLQSTVTVGVLSGTHRRVESAGERYTDFLQTDAAINPGNSGGALLTINGDLIGINTQIDARGQNLGFAIPVARVRKAYHELAKYGAVQDAWLGLDADAYEPDDPAARRLKVPDGRGLVVQSIMQGSPVDAAGLRPGDVILDVQGERVLDDDQWRTALARIRVGDQVRLTAWRDGARLSVTAQAETFPMDRGAELLWNAVGLSVQLAESRRGAPVLVISGVREGSEAYRIGLHRGLVVVGVDGSRLDGAEELYRAVIRGLSRGSVLLAISDGRATYRVPLEVG
jgi:serine protease Do